MNDAKKLEEIKNEILTDALRLSAPELAQKILVIIDRKERVAKRVPVEDRS